MPIQSRWTIDLPECSLPTYLFGSPTGPLDDHKPQFLDALDPSRFLTRAGYRLWCQRFAAGLRKAGLQPGERVLLFSANNLLFPVAFMGIVMAGGIFTGANPIFTAGELAYQIKDSDPAFIFCNDEALEVAVEAAGSLGFDKDKLFVFNGKIFDGDTAGKDGYRSWADLLVPEEDGRSFVWDDLRAPGACHTTLALNYSSGTTGLPKGVEITHKNYVANTAQDCLQTTERKDYQKERHLYRALGFLPMYHAYGQSVFISCAFTLTIPVYIMTKFDFVQMLQCIEKYRISTLLLVPPIVVALVKSPMARKFDLSSVMTMKCGAAPLGKDVQLEAEALFAQSQSVNLKQGWGMTETTCSVLGWDANKTCTNSSVGEPNANCEIAIMPPSSEVDLQSFNPSLELPRHIQGELWVRAPNVMKGYWRNPTATAATLTQDHWLKTGDICYVDSENYVYVVDRLKELIKVKGHQVAPAELESLLLDHPSVLDVAVIGIPATTTTSSDELIRAYIVRTPASNLSDHDQASQITAWLNPQLAKYKHLTADHGVRFVDAIPKNPSGKILRRKLREMYEKEAREGRARL